METQPVKVLVVDDEAAMRRGICVSLVARGYSVEEARSGEEAIAAFHERKADARIARHQYAGNERN